MLGDIYENHVRTLLLAWLLEDNLPLSKVTTLAFRAARVEASWVKLNSYHGHTDDTSAYFSATVIEQKWGPYSSLADYIRPLKDRMTERWRNEYRPAPSAVSQPVVEGAQMTSTSTSIFEYTRIIALRNLDGG